MVVIIIIKDSAHQAALKGTIMLVAQEKRNDRKSQKNRSEEKVVGFCSTSLFPARKQEAVTRVEIDGG